MKCENCQWLNRGKTPFFSNCSGIKPVDREHDCPAYEKFVPEKTKG